MTHSPFGLEEYLLNINIIEILQEIIKFIHFVLATKVAKFAKQRLFFFLFFYNVIG